MAYTKRKILSDQRAATAIEYGLIVALIVLAMIVGLTQFATAAIGMWNHVSNTVAGS